MVGMGAEVCEFLQGRGSWSTSSPCGIATLHNARGIPQLLIPLHGRFCGLLVVLVLPIIPHCRFLCGGSPRRCLYARALSGYFRD